MSTRADRMLELMDQATRMWHIPVIGKAKGRLLRRLMAQRKPRHAVEIGSLLGYSAILIADALPRDGRLTCIEANPYLAKFVVSNAEHAGLGPKVSVAVGDARRIIPTLSGPIDFVLIDAAKEQYLEYLRRLERKLAPGAIVVADNTGIFRRDVKPYIDHVRDASGRYRSREHAFGDDALEVSVLQG